MGNQNSINQDLNSNLVQLNLQHSSLTYLHQVQKATLVKCENQKEIKYQDNHAQTSQRCVPSFFLEKIFVSDSQQQYRLLSKYLEKQSLFNAQNQPSEIIKIVKLYQQAQKGLCSNRYLLKVLFQFSDITLRDELRIRSIKGSNKNSNSQTKHHFNYEDLCSILFACISSLFAAEKLKNNLRKFIQKNLSQNQHDLTHFSDFYNQFRYNIPLNLERIIIMPDGTIKVIHPLLLNHQDRIQHSNKFFYSPEKMKDFLIQDGIKGRIFEAALIVLQCALIENIEQMGKVYNGYCINQAVLQEKINSALNIYRNLQQTNDGDLKIFDLLNKMLQLNVEKRISLNQCIKQAQDLFQLNKRLKQSINYNNFQQQKKYQSKQRMQVQDLQSISFQRIKMKVPPLTSKRHEANPTIKEEQKTTARMRSLEQTQIKNIKPNPQIQVSHFDQIIEKGQQYMQTGKQNTRISALQSLFIINNDHQDITKQNKDKFIQSLIGKNSDLYYTQQYDFLKSKFQYQKLNFNQLKSSQIEEKLQSNLSSCQNFNNSLGSNQLRYKKIIQQSAKKSSHKKSKQKLGGFIRCNLLRKNQTQKSDQSQITNSKFMEIDQIYDKYDFMLKDYPKQTNFTDKFVNQSFVSIKNQQIPQNIDQSYALIGKDSFSISVQNIIKTPSKKSRNQAKQQTNKKSEVLQKITSELINQKLNIGKILRQQQKE